MSLELVRTVTRRTASREGLPIALDVEQWTNARPSADAATVQLISIRCQVSESEVALELVGARQTTGDAPRDVIPFRLLVDSGYQRGAKVLLRPFECLSHPAETTVLSSRETISFWFATSKQPPSGVSS